MNRYGWHVLPKNKQLRYSDDRKVRVGQRIEFKVQELILGSAPIICQQGMHASPEIEDALSCWADLGVNNDGAWLCRVLVEGTNYKGRSRSRRNSSHPKFVGTHRTVLGMIPLAVYQKISWAIYNKTGRERPRLVEAEVKRRMQRRNAKNHNLTVVR